MPTAETIVFRGIKFRRYPESKHIELNRYYKCSGNQSVHGQKSLHRAIWVDANGPIPKWYHVHHINKIPTDNRLENLSCIPEGEHHRIHAKDKSREVQLRTINHARKFACLWHGSPEGREWHRKHGKEVAASIKPRDFVCEWCGSPFKSKKWGKRGARFCHINCKMAARRSRKADNENRSCAWCGGSFSCNRFTKIACCSRACGLRESWRRRRIRADG